MDADITNIFKIFTINCALETHIIHQDPPQENPPLITLYTAQTPAHMLYNICILCLCSHKNPVILAVLSIINIMRGVWFKKRVGTYNIYNNII